MVRPAARSGSPLDVPGIDAGLSRKEILELVRESRRSTGRLLRQSRAPQLTVSSVPVFRGNRVRVFLFDLDEITDHPEFKLFEARFPADLEILHPLAALRRIGHVHHQPHQIVSAGWRRALALRLASCRASTPQSFAGPGHRLPVPMRELT